jgi:hypothetical protein
MTEKEFKMFQSAVLALLANSVLHLVLILHQATALLDTTVSSMLYLQLQLMELLVISVQLGTTVLGGHIHSTPVNQVTLTHLKGFQARISVCLVNMAHFALPVDLVIQVETAVLDFSV